MYIVVNITSLHYQKAKCKYKYLVFLNFNTSVSSHVRINIGIQSMKSAQRKQVVALNIVLSIYKKGVPSAVGFPHCAGSGEGLFLSPKSYPHKCAEAGARTRDLPVTDGRLKKNICTICAKMDRIPITAETCKGIKLKAQLIRKNPLRVQFT